jgi:anti-sigma28 factor (negative regulator of flagellin synthesis)
MKVYESNLSGTTGETARAAETQRLDRESSVRTRSTAAPGGGDRVELSNALGSLSRALSSYGSGRSERVQALTEQYQSGKYQADALATSRGMIAEAMAGGAQ